MRYSHAVVGLGESGVSAATFLLEKGLPVLLTDTRPCPPGLAVLQARFPGVACHVGGLEAAHLRAADTLVLSPGLSRQHPLIAAEVARGKPVIGDIELFARESAKTAASVIAITGTNAKSTVTTLVGKMAQAAGRKVAVGGNLGPPALDLLAEKPDLFVLELSSFQLESVSSLAPLVASVLNVTPDHLDRHGSLAACAQIKRSIYRLAENVVCNHDDPLTACEDAGASRLDFGLQTGAPDMACLAEKSGEKWLALCGERLLPVQALPLSGWHAVANALAALAIGHLAGFSCSAMTDTLLQFRGLPHRCQWVRERQGVRWFNDSKGTNVGATLAAIAGLGHPVPHLVLIAGGVGKGADFSPLLPAVRQHVKSVVLLGEAADTLAQLFQAVVPVRRASSMQEAVQLAAGMARPGEDVLLSPACASLDMFRNFEHRGEVFEACVKAL